MAVCDTERTAALKSFFAEHRRVAVAFSGGVDSSYLLYAAVQSGAEVGAYYVRSAFQPQFELEDARRMARHVGVPLRELSADVLAEPEIVQNPPDRCYHCKLAVFSRLWEAARRDGYPVLADGTNASDDAADRPGMRALKELGVCSPLRDAGLRKDEIRRLSREAGLFTWEKPSYACLATRIPAGVAITAELLARTEEAEGRLMELGFRNFRVRTWQGAARLQVTASQLELALALRPQLLEILRPLYGTVLLDLEVRDGE